MNLDNTMPNKKAKFSSRSTAARTKMLTVCKNCGNQNDNGYQYCTACHTAHRGKNNQKQVLIPVYHSDEKIVCRAPNPIPIFSAEPEKPVIDPDEVLKVCAEEL